MLYGKWILLRIIKENLNNEYGIRSLHPAVHTYILHCLFACITGRTGG